MSEILSPSQSEREAASPEQIVRELRQIQAQLVLDQLLKPSLNPPARLLTDLSTPVGTVLAQREGSSEKSPPEHLVRSATNLLKNLIRAANSGYVLTIQRETMERFPGSEGEHRIARLKTVGHRISLSTGARGITSEQVANSVLGCFELPVSFKDGQVFNRSFTEPWWKLAVSAGLIPAPELDERGRMKAIPKYFPRSYEEVKALFLRMSAEKSKRTSDDVFYVVVEAHSEMNTTPKVDVLALASATDAGSKKDLLIHESRLAVFPLYERLIDLLTKSYKTKPLSDRDQKKIEDAVDAIVRSGLGLNAHGAFQTFIEALCQVEAFRHLSPGDQNYVINKWLSIIWIGTGDKGKKNKPGVGLSARLPVSGVATIGS